MLAQTREKRLAALHQALGTNPVREPGRGAAQRHRADVHDQRAETAFQIGFMVFIPFLVIDLVVASVLMSMGR